MKKTLSSIILLVLAVLFVSTAFSQTGGMGINTDGSDPDASAILDVKSTTQGVLFPRMTSTQRTAISSPAVGLLVYQTNGEAGFYYYTGSGWSYLGAGSGSSSVPAGTIMAFGGDVVNIPTGWILCNGAAINRVSYSDLYNAIGTAWGVGDGSTTFNIPDLRGQFLRGVNMGSGNDPDAGSRTANNGGNSGDNVGSYQGDEFKSHSHKVGTNTTRGDNTIWQHSDIDLRLGDQRDCQNTGGSETRPKNAGVHYIIKL